MSGFIPEIIKEASRSLRKNMTISEKKIWEEIKGKKLGYKFLRQKPIYLYSENSGLERYIIPDFCCLELKLVLEIDGSIHNKKEVYLLDKEKELLLRKKGFNIIRVSNEEINKDLNNVINKLEKFFP